MADDAEKALNRPDILLMIQEGLPDDIETDARAFLHGPSLNFMVIRQPGGPYAGIELYLPTAIGLFVAVGFFNGVLQELGKDAYVGLKSAAVALWRRSASLNVTAIGTAGKVSPRQRYSLAYSITGEVLPGLNFKFLIQTEIDPDTADAGIEAFLALIDDLLNDRVAEADVKALLTYKPVGGTVLVAFDADSRKIVPVDAFGSAAGS
jgi:hypothetical protein